MMNAVPPLRFESALKSCTKSPRSAAYWSALLRPRHALSRSQRRWMSDGGKPPPPFGAQEKTKIYAPKTRIAVGVVFIGALIYSMATGNNDTPSEPSKNSHQMEKPSIADRDKLAKRESGI